MARLWIPVTSLLALALPISLEKTFLFRNAATRLPIVGAIVCLMSLNLMLYIAHHEKHPFHDPVFASLNDMFSEVRSNLVLQGNVLTPNAQAFGLFTGVPAPITVPLIGI